MKRPSPDDSVAGYMDDVLARTKSTPKMDWSSVFLGFVSHHVFPFFFLRKDT